uniref:Cullin N-terminal domain-containing protein n=1 Tax=Ascaris lumbricoides TaxID=6252 RepID=A0A0M3HRU2_ASCLU
MMEERTKRLLDQLMGQTAWYGRDNFRVYEEQLKQSALCNAGGCIRKLSVASNKYTLRICQVWKKNFGSDVFAPQLFDVYVVAAVMLRRKRRWRKSSFEDYLCEINATEGSDNKCDNSLLEYLMNLCHVRMVIIQEHMKQLVHRRRSSLVR